MTWLIVVFAVVVFVLVVYFAKPLISKLIKKAKEKAKARKDKSTKKQIDKIEKEEKKLEKKQKVQEETAIIENAGDDFFEDPDTKVNYDNFDVGGFFEKESKPIFKDESPFVEDDDFSNNIDEMFEKYFSNEIRPSERSSYNPFGEISESDDELREFLEELNSGKSESSQISEDFKNLSPEMKALMISNFLDRKDDI